MSLATPGYQELDKGVEVSNSFCFDCHPATEAGCAMGGGVCFFVSILCEVLKSPGKGVSLHWPFKKNEKTQLRQMRCDVMKKTHAVRRMAPAFRVCPGAPAPSSSWLIPRADVWRPR